MVITTVIHNFKKEDVGKFIIIGNPSWIRKLWYFVWFRVLRRKTPTYGMLLITGVTSGTITVSTGAALKNSDELTFS